MSRIIRKDNSF